MRIIAGEARGRKLAELGKGDAAAHLRPTSDRVRESLFNMLASMNAIEGAEVLDLFAGTGALGLEALSRGAAAARFVENGRVALGLLERNIDITGSSDRAQVLRQDARAIGRNSGAPATLVFLDPPYDKRLGEAALAAALEGGWIAPGAVIAWEESAPVLPPPGLAQRGKRRYGDTQITLFAYAG
ncbi:16S rRNA (guanine(966)-N(2))-methyltransferase RsmD [Roseovarius aquimarinus]|uniref:16S rRNA (Guanine(966)-N(2))-methyltransferase RsmD n=1 Tax=Roseovarius aquimarinus TaxID=1229156 RepID=A0ABW7IAQ6_9RHOB